MKHYGFKFKVKCPVSLVPDGSDRYIHWYLDKDGDLDETDIIRVGEEITQSGFQVIECVRRREITEEERQTGLFQLGPNTTANGLTE